MNRSVSVACDDIQQTEIVVKVNQKTTVSDLIRCVVTKLNHVSAIGTNFNLAVRDNNGGESLLVPENLLKDEVDAKRKPVEKFVLLGIARQDRTKEIKEMAKELDSISKKLEALHEERNSTSSSMTSSSSSSSSSSSNSVATAIKSKFDQLTDDLYALLVGSANVRKNQLTGIHTHFLTNSLYPVLSSPHYRLLTNRICTLLLLLLDALRTTISVVGRSNEGFVVGSDEPTAIVTTEWH